MDNKYDTQNEKYMKCVKKSILISLCGIFVSYFLSINVSIISWLACLFSLLLMAICFGNAHRTDILMIGFVSISFQLISALVFNNHLLDNANSIGTNANLISWLFYILIMSAAATGRHYLNVDNILDIMQYMLNCASISAAIVLFIDYRKIVTVISGSFNPYTAALWGFFQNKNMFGMVCALGLIAGVYCIFTPRKNKATLLKCSFLLVMLILSFCRTAWLFAGLFFVAFLLQNIYARNQHNRKINRRLFWLFIIVGCIFLVVVLNNSTLRSTIETNFLRLDIGDAGRKSIQERLLSEFKDRGLMAFLCGIGYSEYSFLCSIDVHNVYLYTFVTGGITKLIAFMVLLLFSFRTNKRCGDILLRHFGLSVLFSFLIISFFETYEPFEVGLSNMILFIYIMLLPMLRGADSSSFSITSRRNVNEK